MTCTVLWSVWDITVFLTRFTYHRYIGTAFCIWQVTYPCVQYQMVGMIANDKIVIFFFSFVCTFPLKIRIYCFLNSLTQTPCLIFTCFVSLDIQVEYSLCEWISEYFCCYCNHSFKVRAYPQLWEARYLCGILFRDIQPMSTVVRALRFQNTTYIPVSVSSLTFYRYQ